MTQDSYDVVVVGGGAAGLAGATALARSRRSVLVVDAGEPRNATADGVHNYLGREGTPPAELYAIGATEVEHYGGEVHRGSVVAATPTGSGGRLAFTVTLDDGTRVRARRLLVTTGATDRLPDVPGLRERWGRDVLHCPFCHGWEVRDQAVAVLATGPMAAHQALLFRQLTDDVLVLDPGSHTGPEDRVRLRARGIAIIEDPVSGIRVEDDRLVGVQLSTGEVVARDALVVASVVEARSDLLDSLGCTVEPLEMNGVVLGTHVVTDPAGRTSVPGVWAAGNVAAPMAQVVVSAAAGLTAGAQVNAELVEEDTAAAVEQVEEAS